VDGVPWFLVAVAPELPAPPDLPAAPQPGEQAGLSVTADHLTPPVAEMAAAPPVETAAEDSVSQAAASSEDEWRSSAEAGQAPATEKGPAADGAAPVVAESTPPPAETVPPAASDLPPVVGGPVIAWDIPAPETVAEREQPLDEMDPAATLKMVRPAFEEAPAAASAATGETLAAAAQEEVATNEDLDTAPPAEPSPKEFLHAVDRFNRRHELVFEAIRREIGAGARNFVLTCVRRLGAQGAAFGGLAPDKTGRFEREALGRELLRCSETDPFESLEVLIRLEVSLVRDLMDSTRVRTLEDRLRNTH
jgi:hypothetical protein